MPCYTTQLIPTKKRSLSASFRFVESEGFEPSSKQRIPMSSTCLVFDSFSIETRTKTPNISTYPLRSHTAHEKRLVPDFLK